MLSMMHRISYSMYSKTDGRQHKCRNCYLISGDLFQSYRGRKPLGAVVPAGLSPGVPSSASPGPAPAAPSPAPATTPAMKQDHPSQPMVSVMEIPPHNTL